MSTTSRHIYPTINYNTLNKMPAQPLPSKFINIAFCSCFYTILSLGLAWAGSLGRISGSPAQASLGYGLTKLTKQISERSEARNIQYHHKALQCNNEKPLYTPLLYIYDIHSHNITKALRRNPDKLCYVRAWLIFVILLVI